MMTRGETDVGPLIREAAERMECHEDEVRWFSWPEAFGSTAGPRGGIGGQAITTFQVFGFEGPKGLDLLYCAGVWRVWRDREQRWPRK